MLLQAADNKLRIDNMKEGLTASGDEIVDKWGKGRRNSEQNYDWDQNAPSLALALQSAQSTSSLV